VRRLLVKICGALARYFENGEDPVACRNLNSGESRSPKAQRYELRSERFQKHKWLMEWQLPIGGEYDQLDHP